MVAYMCPECGAAHVAGELSGAETVWVTRGMLAELTARMARAAGKD